MPVSTLLALAASSEWRPEPKKKKKKKYVYKKPPPQYSALGDTAATNSRTWAARRTKYCPDHAPTTLGVVAAVQQLSSLFRLLTFEADPKTRRQRLPNKCEDLIEVFERCDEDGDGLIDRSEYMVAMDGLMRRNRDRGISTDDLQSIFTKFDIHGKNRIELTKFIDLFCENEPAKTLWLVRDHAPPKKQVQAKKKELVKSTEPYRPGVTFNASYEKALAARVATSDEDLIRKQKEKEAEEKEWEDRQAHPEGDNNPKKQIVKAMGSGRRLDFFNDNPAYQPHKNASDSKMVQQLDPYGLDPEVAFGNAQLQGTAHRQTVTRELYEEQLRERRELAEKRRRNALLLAQASGGMGEEFVIQRRLDMALATGDRKTAIEMTAALQQLQTGVLQQSHTKGQQRQQQQQRPQTATGSSQYTKQTQKQRPHSSAGQTKSARTTIRPHTALATRRPHTAAASTDKSTATVGKDSCASKARPQTAVVRTVQRNGQQQRAATTTGKQRAATTAGKQRPATAVQFKANRRPMTAGELSQKESLRRNYECWQKQSRRRELQTRNEGVGAPRNMAQMPWQNGGLENKSRFLRPSSSSSSSSSSFSSGRPHSSAHAAGVNGPNGYNGGAATRRPKSAALPFRPDLVGGGGRARTDSICTESICTESICTESSCTESICTESICEHKETGTGEAERRRSSVRPAKKQRKQKSAVLHIAECGHIAFGPCEHAKKGKEQVAIMDSMTTRDMLQDLKGLGCTNEQLAREGGNRSKLAFKLAALKITKGVRLIVDGGGHAGKNVRKQDTGAQQEVDRRASIALARKQRGGEEPKEATLDVEVMKPSKYGVMEMLREIEASERENRRLGNQIYMPRTGSTWREDLRAKEEAEEAKRRALAEAERGW
jgi:hypothetical protein